MIWLMNHIFNSERLDLISDSIRYLNLFSGILLRNYTNWWETVLTNHNLWLRSWGIFLDCETSILLKSWAKFQLTKFLDKWLLGCGKNDDETVSWLELGKK